MIGCGYFGAFQLSAWKRMDDVELIGIVEQSSDRRFQLELENANLKTVSAIDDLLAIDEPNVIDIATPPHTHASIIRSLLGKVPTIVCQKPFCTSMGDARAIVDEARMAGTKLIVHENFRFMPWYRAIKTIIDSGKLGSVRQANFRFRPGDGAGADAYLARQPYFRDMERFLVHETAIHWIDTFRFLFGEPKTVYADLWRENSAIKGEDGGLIFFKFEDNLRVTFDGNRTLDHAADNHRLTMGELIIEGTRASLHLNGFGEIFIRMRGETSNQKEDFTFQSIDFGGDCVFLTQRHIVDHLTKGLPLEIEASAYLTNLKIEDAIYQSAKMGKDVAV